MWQAILFDLDGTLLDTIEDVGFTVNMSLSREHFPPHYPLAFKRMVGTGARNLIRQALPREQRDEETIERCLAHFQALYPNHWHHATKPYEGVPGLLDALHQRELPLAVLSNKPHELTERLVERQLGGWRFEVVLGHRQGAPLKPEPAGALEIARQMEIDLEKFLYVGDSAVDMRTAAAADMTPLGVGWGYQATDELTVAGARALLDEPAELLAVLDGTKELRRPRGRRPRHSGSR